MGRTTSDGGGPSGCKYLAINNNSALHTALVELALQYWKTQGGIDFAMTTDIIGRSAGAFRQSVSILLCPTSIQTTGPKAPSTKDPKTKR